jgi:hypothetical protein
MVMFELCRLHLAATDQTYLKQHVYVQLQVVPVYGMTINLGLVRNNGKKTLGIFPDFHMVEQCVAVKLCWISDTQ